MSVCVCHSTDKDDNMDTEWHRLQATRQGKHTHAAIAGAPVGCTANPSSNLHLSDQKLLSGVVRPLVCGATTATDKLLLQAAHSQVDFTTVCSNAPQLTVTHYTTSIYLLRCLVGLQRSSIFFASRKAVIVLQPFLSTAGFEMSSHLDLLHKV